MEMKQEESEFKFVFFTSLLSACVVSLASLAFFSMHNLDVLWNSLSLL